MCLYICDISEFMGLDGLPLLPPARRERTLLYRQPKDRARSLAAGLLLRRFLGVTEDSQLVYGKSGKPYLRDGSLFFSISHSGAYVLLATSENETGADMEIIAPRHRAVAGRCFTGPELAWMRQEAADAAFFRLWTGKESVMKLLGCGLSLSPQSFSLLPMDGSPHHICGKTMYFDWREHHGHIICRASHKVHENSPLTPVTARELRAA